MSRGWQLSAWLGLAAVAVADLWSSFPLSGAQGKVILLAGVLVLASLMVSFILMPEAVDVLWRHREVLAPLALLIVTLRFLGWIASFPGLAGLFSAAFPFRFVGISLAFSLHFAVAVLASAAYGAWTTGILIGLVRRGKHDLGRALRPALNRFWIVLGAEAISWTVIFIAAGLFLMLMPMIGWFAFVPMVLVAVVVNIATAALLPVVCETRLGFVDSVRLGVRVSLTNKHEWLVLLVAQMLLLGTLTFFFRSSSGETNMNWGVNAFWIGGYEDDSRWYGKAVETFATSKVPILTTFLSFVFGVLAVAVKLAIIQRMPAPAAASFNETETSATAG